jgi:flagellar hook protein FlgE
MNISNNINALQTNQQMMDQSAKNIANLNTPNSNVDLTREIPKQIVAQDVASVNVSTIKTQDDMFGSLLDIKS